MKREQYELLYILPPQYTEGELQPLKEKIRDLITKASGLIVGDKDLGRKRLAYPVKKLTQGYYHLFEFDGDADKVQRLDRDLRLLPEIIRHLLVRREIAPPPPVRRKPAAVAVPPLAPPTDGLSADIKPKVSLEELNKKLDEILDSNIV